MAIDAVTPDAAPPQTQRRDNPKPVYEGQPYYTFDEVMESLSFWDVVDIFNPLQHIPIVNLIYRELTGDEINGAAQVAGGALFGGVVGLGSAIATMAFDEITDGGVRQMARGIFGEDDDSPAPLMADSGLGGLGIGVMPAGPGAAPMPGAAGPAVPASGPAFAGVTRPGTGLAVDATLIGADMIPAAASGLAGGDPMSPAHAASMAALTTSLDGTQSAALAAFVAQHNTPGRAEGPARASGPAPSPAGPDAPGRSGLFAPPSSGASDQQGQDMNEHARHGNGGNGAANPETGTGGGAGTPDREQSPARPTPRAAAVPPEIQEGREALRARLAAARADSGAEGPGAAAADGATLGGKNAADRPTGMTLADYRANPNRLAEGRSDHDDGRDGPTAAVGGVPARAIAGILPDAATMAGLMERNHRVASAADQRARQAANGLGADLARGENAFRAMPVGGQAPTPADGAQPTPSGVNAAAGPVVTQPWFSQRVLDAMREYDATRRAETS